ncbi:hypothetical protein Mgra_00002801 [Meloidogyne graminicola]|uniref:Uncharacterized protein n=1 Tax=Meloidogyne graminicola TaxID=189291 RepID=A0A8S9ZWY4_9BILA|nr:hypothetical protein Mgra_00002801 [Meloidogyne graminicola]
MSCSGQSRFFNKVSKSPRELFLRIRMKSNIPEEETDLFKSRTRPGEFNASNLANSMKGGELSVQLGT